MGGVSGPKVTYTKYDMPVGQWPYNIDVTPNGKLALTADNGNNGQSDGPTFMRRAHELGYTLVKNEDRPATSSPA